MFQHFFHQTEYDIEQVDVYSRYYCTKVNQAQDEESEAKVVFCKTRLSKPNIELYLLFCLSNFPRISSLPLSQKSYLYEDLFSSSCHSNQSKTAFHVNKVLTIQGSTCTQHIAQHFPILNFSENLILCYLKWNLFIYII